jgi:hypothetical protein
MNAYPELNEAVSSGKDAFDTRVERALAERAAGYSVDVEECFVINGKVHKEIVRKYYPPDVTACIYWTKNRMPDRWRDSATRGQSDRSQVCRGAAPTAG